MKEFEKLISEFGVNDKGLNFVGDEEGIEGDMISCGGFHEDALRFEVIDDREELMETLEGLRESVLAKDLGVVVRSFSLNLLIGS